MPDLVIPVSTRDHVQGSLDADIILLEYGDYECPDCAAAYPAVREIQDELGDRLCFAYRHFPLVEMHSHAEPAAEAAEEAGAQGRFWEMHNRLFENWPRLEDRDLMTYAQQIGLDVEEFRRQVRARVHLDRIKEDIESGTQSGVDGTPTFFINGKRHTGPNDVASLLDRMRVAR